jgi:calcineurin-like phosphoesterase family protein
MNATMVENWNKLIKPTDQVIFLGDFAFTNGCEHDGNRFNAKYWRDQLNGIIVYLTGNHDKKNSMNTHIKSLVVEYKNYSFFCTHRPIDYNKEYPINLVGHIHEKWLYRYEEDGTLLINVGVDQWNFTPVSLHSILKLIANVK